MKAKVLVLCLLALAAALLPFVLETAESRPNESRSCNLGPCHGNDPTANDPPPHWRSHDNVDLSVTYQECTTDGLARYLISVSDVFIPDGEEGWAVFKWDDVAAQQTANDTHGPIAQKLAGDSGPGEFLADPNIEYVFVGVDLALGNEGYVKVIESNELDPLPEESCCNDIDDDCDGVICQPSFFQRIWCWIWYDLVMRTLDIFR